jgi:hypothetical protein
VKKSGDILEHQQLGLSTTGDMARLPARVGRANTGKYQGRSANFARNSDPIEINQQLRPRIGKESRDFRRGDLQRKSVAWAKGLRPALSSDHVISENPMLRPTQSRGEAPAAKCLCGVCRRSCGLKANPLTARHDRPYSHHRFRLAGHSAHRKAGARGRCLLGNRAVPVGGEGPFLGWAQGHHPLRIPGQRDRGLKPQGAG